jgi:ABC-type uncharacterized transport system auxiliary subunit
VLRKSLMAAALAAVLAGCVATSTPAAATWAGLTQPQAIDKAAKGLLSLTLAFKPQTTPATLLKARRWMDAHAPRTRKVTCSGQRLWQVTWPKSDSVYVSRKTVLLGCNPKR